MARPMALIQSSFSLSESAMTCANYIQLPPYRCRPVRRERLLYAITEGTGSFLLS